MRELWDGIVESVNSLCKNRPVLLPLSGGYDSSVLLGALKILGHTNVTCFSFVAGRPRRGSDADVARKQAGVCGYPHLAIDISDSKLYETMTLGRIAGQTLRVTPDEISGYAKLADIADGEAIMAFGEESFGYDGWVFEDPSDVLASVILHSPHAIPLPHDVRESLISEYRTMYGRAASLGNYYNENDYLYLDHRLSMNMLPLRTYSAAHWFDICSPFLSPPLLGVVAALSPSDRRNKALYKSMAKAQLPELFSIRRAYRSQTTSVFLTDVLTNREQYLARAECERWNVPDLIDVAQVQDLIRQGSDRQGSESAYRAWAETALYAIGMHEKAKDIIVARRRPRFNRTPDRLKLLRRIMTLAFALQHRSSGPCRIKTAEAT
jgi:hypothetical protein